MELNEKSPEELQKKLGKAIERIRISKNVPAKNIADELKLSLSAYRNIERGLSEVTFLKIVRIAQVLNVSYTEILEIEKGNVYQNTNHTGDGNTNTAGTHHSFVFNQIESGYKVALAEQKELINHLRQQNRELMAMLKGPKSK
jgi:transcriptional regulator with XRE-family HTH domain